jgi:hypothetical protein
MKEGHTVLISYFSPHPKREKKQCRKYPETSSEQAAHHVLALPLMASSDTQELRFHHVQCMHYSSTCFLEEVISHHCLQSACHVFAFT